MKDAITTVGAGSILNECYRGDTQLCSLITRDANGLISEIAVTPVNLASQMVRGIDFELGYTMPFLDGDLSFRGLATHYIKAESSNGTDLPNSSLGTSTRDWQYMVSGTYRTDDISFTLTGRGVSSGVYLTNGIECQTGCPTATPDRPTINNNHVAAALYLDAYFGWKPVEATEFYVAIDNLADKAPAVVASGPSIGSAPYGSSANFYDLIGRTVRAGVRFNF